MIAFIKKVYACENGKNPKLIANSLLWAGVIIAGGWMTRGAENANVISMLLIGAASISVLFVNNQRKG